MSGKRASIPNPDRFLARTPTEKMLSAAGVPVHFWNTDLKRVKFRGSTFRGRKLSATATRSYLEADLREPPRRQPIVVVASQPTDTGALYLAYGVMVQYGNIHSVPTAIINAAEDVPHFQDYPPFVLVHNILDKATAERVEKVRDVLLRFPVAFRVVVLAGVADPEKWLKSRVGIYPDLVVRVGDMTKKDLVAE